MSEKHDDGGSAYPTPMTEYDDGSGGMALLDWFAGQALAGLLTQPPIPGSVNWSLPGDVDAIRSARAYNLAAAMVAEKRRRRG